MKIRSALILTVLTAAVVGYQSSASSASRLSSNSIVAQHLNTESLEGISSEIARLALTASAADALSMSDETLAQQEVVTALEVSSHPSAHFVSAAYSYAQRSNNDTTALLAAIAKTPTAPLGILNELASHKSSEIRVALATNPAITAEIAATLQKDQTREIKLGLVLNTSFARIAPSAAADLIIEVSSATATSETLKSAYVKKLAERTNYHGIAKRLLEERSSSQEAEQVASRFVQTINSLSAL